MDQILIWIAKKPWSAVGVIGTIVSGTLLIYGLWRMHKEEQRRARKELMIKLRKIDEQWKQDQKEIEEQRLRNEQRYRDWGN